MKTPCSEALSELPLFVGGDLEPQAEQRVARHLEHCPSCQEAQARAVAAREVLREHFADPAVDLHRPELWGAVRAGLLESGQLRASASAASSSPALEPASVPSASRRRWLQLVPVAAAAAGLFFLGTLAGRETPDSSREELTPAPGVGAGALALEQPATPQELTPVGGPGLTPLGADSPSLRQEAWPWLGDVLPLTSPRPIGASAAGLSSAASYRSDGVR